MRGAAVPAGARVRRGRAGRAALRVAAVVAGAEPARQPGAPAAGPAAARAARRQHRSVPCRLLREQMLQSRNIICFWI